MFTPCMKRGDPERLRSALPVDVKPEDVPRSSRILKNNRGGWAFGMSFSGPLGARRPTTVLD